MTVPGRLDLSDQVIRGAAVASRHLACGGDLALPAGDDRGQVFPGVHSGLREYHAAAGLHGPVTSRMGEFCRFPAG